MGSITVESASGVPFFTPAQTPPVGSALNSSSAPALFQPHMTRGLTVHNRFVVSPMCTYSADNGHLTDWHVSHYGQFALGGAGLVMVEATAVEARGRIAPEDSGLWLDSHIPPLRRIVDVLHSQGSKAAIQLSHAGRKASTLTPWLGGSAHKTVADESLGGWPTNVVAPSAIPYDISFPMPKAMTRKEIEELISAFAQSARRAVIAGFDAIELQGAHGYLLTQFLSPITNKRTDDYGGSYKNRTRLLREIIAAVRAVIPTDMPLWLRISATEWMEHTGKPSWDVESTLRLAKELPTLGVDVLDVSAGGNSPAQRIDVSLDFQTEIATKARAAVRAEGLDLAIAAVGNIAQAEKAKSLLEGSSSGKAGSEHEQMAKADFVVAARQFLREPKWPLKAAQQLDVPVKWPIQYIAVQPRP